MNILSLFDGISCAHIALDKLNIPISNYYASEIDKYAIKVSKENNPNIIHLGDVRNIEPKKLPKIDLLIGGSPCQDLSNAQKGEGLKGEKSRLFYEYIRIFKEIKPKYFLLENVQNKWGNLMSEIIGVEHILINSSLFSAQSRPRYYWTNIDINNLPTELHKEKIKDIKEDNVSEKYFFNKQPVLDFLKSIDIDNKKTETKEGIVKLFDLPKEVHNDNERQRRVYSLESKSPTILARTDTTKIYDNGRIRKLTPLECERLQKIPDNYTISCSDTQRYKMIGNAFTVDTITHILKGLK
ncbi:hypothetical protein CRV00_09875 [Malaciobacter molluscorum]|uniref:DNA cytosine methyltransferase n=1 Tax=Malaciobacter molluscorum TaxID=1032072 RepID=UPI00100BAB51|nr:DNA (cytosine-5-)-methyltransferase [Malaciobacter molluscorum]RXJ93760.1 hypothetical protein CRV00_09875 [Malaciobacter molluscorum]